MKKKPTPKLLKDTFQDRLTPKSDFLLRIEAQQRNAKRREARAAKQHVQKGLDKDRTVLYPQKFAKSAS